MSRQKAPYDEQIAVIGSGSWATALVKILMEKRVQVRWWLHRKEDVAYIKKYKHNPRYLQDVSIKTEKVKAYSDINRALRKAHRVVLAVPAAYIAPALERIQAEHLKDKTIISGTKGMIPDSDLLVTDYISQQFGLSNEQFVVIAGPCHAEEVAMERLSYLTLAGEDEQRAKATAELMECRYIKASYHNDLYGAEYCAVMKNIMAVASGICHGQNHGDNFQAVLVANGFREMKRFIDAAFPRHRQLIDTAYLGDLMVTAYSQFSRNRTFGNMIGRGYSVNSAQVEMNMVAEGYYAVKSIQQLNKKLNISLPIIDTVYSILYEEAPVQQAIEGLKDKLN